MRSSRPPSHGGLEAGLRASRLFGCATPVTTEVPTSDQFLDWDTEGITSFLSSRWLGGDGLPYKDHSLTPSIMMRFVMAHKAQLATTPEALHITPALATIPETVDRCAAVKCRAGVSNYKI